jgi:hypothetical protein
MRCEDCDCDSAKVVSRAVIEYICPFCYESSVKAGKCTDKECEGYGKPMKRSCSMAGSYPHVAPEK